MISGGDGYEDFSSSASNDLAGEKSTNAINIIEKHIAKNRANTLKQCHNNLFEKYISKNGANTLEQCHNNHVRKTYFQKMCKYSSSYRTRRLHESPFALDSLDPSKSLSWTWSPTQQTSKNGFLHLSQEWTIFPSFRAPATLPPTSKRWSGFYNLRWYLHLWWPCCNICQSRWKFELFFFLDEAFPLPGTVICHDMY